MPFLLNNPRRVPGVSRHGHISASQVKTAQMCLRKWAFDKVWGVHEPTKYHFAVGHALHALAERYHGKTASSWEGLFPPGWDKGIQQPDAALIRTWADAAVRQGVWQARDGIIIEHPVALLVGKRMLDDRGIPLLARAVTYENDRGVREMERLVAMESGEDLPPGWDDLAPFIGFIDIFDVWASGMPLVEDHKTAKNRTYTLTAESLAQDTQMLTYAAVALALRPDPGMVRLKHNVFLKDPKNPEVFETSAVVTTQTVAKKWQEIIEAAERMRAVRDNAPRLTPLEHRADNWYRVPGAIDEGPKQEKEACDAYGGCPFKDICKRRCYAHQAIQGLDRRVLMAKVPQRVQPKRQTFSLNMQRSLV